MAPTPGPPYDVQVTDEDIASPIITPSGQRLTASSNVQTAQGEINASQKELVRTALDDFMMMSISQAASMPAVDVAAPSLQDIQNHHRPPFTPGHTPDKTSIEQDISMMQQDVSTSTLGYGHNSFSAQISVTSFDPNQLFGHGKGSRVSNHIASFDPDRESSEPVATASTGFEASTPQCYMPFEILTPPLLSESAPNTQRASISRRNDLDFPNSMQPSRGNPCAQNEVLYRRNQQQQSIGQITAATDGQGRVYEIHQEVKCPELARFSERLQTFRNRTNSWAIPISREQLASAGFYLIRGSHVKCFACDKGLDNWDSTDDPFLEHVAWYGSICPFVCAVMQRSRNMNAERSPF